MAKRKKAKRNTETDDPDAKRTSMAPAPQGDSKPYPLDFPIVGIGASAGGLKALGELLEAMPDDPNVACVIIQHLDPTRKSLTPELLDQATKMHVAQVEDKARVCPGHVYVIPPNKFMSISGGVLHLSDTEQPRGARMAIDFFLRSLAIDQRQCAVGVILSGTGTDGTLGAKAIKSAGGFVIAQDPATAEFGAMPRSAMESGSVDRVLPPEQIPDLLVRYARHSYVNDDVDSSADQQQQQGEPLTSNELGTVIALLGTDTKHEFRQYKEKTLSRRTRRRMCLLHIDEYQEYSHYLRDHPEEIEALTRDLLITVTDFFRDSAAWEELRRLAIAPMIAGKDDDEPIRVWTSGCATGEEPYSIAMLILDELAKARKKCPLQVFASDIDQESLDFARMGRFPKSIAADVSSQRLKRYFTHDDNDDYYYVNKMLRESVIFAEQNLIADPPFSRMDLICCRNLLIYLKSDIQEKIIAMFHFALRKGGVLFLGSAETIGRQTDLFEPLDKRWRIFRQVGPRQHGRVDIPLMTSGPRREIELGPARPQVRESRLARLAQQRLLDMLSPSSVMVDCNCNILHITGGVDAYLTHRPGVPTENLLEKARRGLRTALRGAVQAALSEERTVSVDARMQSEAGVVPVKLTVRVVKDHEQDEKLALVLFESGQIDDVGRVPRPVTALRPAIHQQERPPQKSGDRTETESKDEDSPAGQTGTPPALQIHHESVIRQLEEELSDVRNDLQASIEQLNFSNEDHKASNEEVMSINEELQSTIEELETSKEELQSLNEELSTVNNQLAGKVEELETKHADLENLLAVTNVPTICLDTDLSVRWFTPAAQDVIRLKPADTGRPLDDVRHDFADDHLVQSAERVLQELTPIEDEASCPDGRTFLRRTTPYRTDDHRIGGVVITLVDITERKKAEVALQAAKEFADMTIDTVRDPMLILASDLHVVSANAAFYKKFEVLRDQTEGALIYELGNHQWDIPNLRLMLEQLLPRQSSITDFEVDYEFETLGRRVMLLNARQISNSNSILVAFDDVTDSRAFARERELLLERSNEENESLEEQVSKRTRMLNLLQDVTRIANEMKTVDDATCAAMERIGKHNGWQLGHIWMLNDDACEQMISSRIWFVSDEAKQELPSVADFQRMCEQSRFKLGEELIGAVAQSAQPRWLDDLGDSTDPRRDSAKRSGLRAAIAFPVVVDDTVPVVLEYFSSHQTVPDPRFLEILPDIGLQLGQLIERKRLERLAADASEREQRRIASDIHDGVGQELTGLRYLAQTHADSLADRSSDAAEVAQRIANGFQTVQTQLRAVIRELIPVELDKNGLPSALQTLAGQTIEAHDVQCEFLCSEPIAIIDHLLATHIFRVAQEAVRNAVKHSEAHSITIRLDSNDAALNLQVFDDGVGIDACPNRDVGFGLHSMGFRAALVGGTFSIEQGRNGGTVVQCRVPLRNIEQKE